MFDGLRPMGPGGTDDELPPEIAAQLAAAGAFHSLPAKPQWQQPATEQRVDDAREQLIEQAMELSAYLTQLAGNRRTVQAAGNVTIQAFNAAVNDYQLALEEH